MKCKYCGEKFDNMGLLLAHYREHKKDETADTEGIIETEETKELKHIEIKEKSIPVDWCANAQYLGNNAMMCMRVLGIKKGDKIMITQVDLI